MEGQISTIKKLDLKKDDMISMVMFDIGLGGNDLKFLEEEFDFYKEDIDNFVASYKNLGFVFKLKANNHELLKDWKMFIDRVINKNSDFDKFNHIFVSKNYDKVLLVTNKRLLNVDLKILNEKIEHINYRIENFDEKLLENTDYSAEAGHAEHKGILSRVLEVLRR